MKRYIDYLKEIYFLISDERNKVPLMIMAFIFASLVEFIGLGLIAPYVGLILSPETFQNNIVFQSIQKIYFISPEDRKLYFGLLLIFVFALKITISYLVNAFILTFSYNKCISIRQELLKSFLRLDYVHYLKKNSSSYIYSYLTLAPTFAQSTLQSILKILSEGFVVLFIFGYLLYKHGKELFLFIIVIGVVLFLYDLIFRKRLVNDGKQIDSLVKNLVKRVGEVLSGLKEIRVLGKEYFFYQDIGYYSKASSDIGSSNAAIKTIPRYLIEFSIVCFTVFLVVVFDKINPNGGKDITATLSVFVVAAMRLTPSINFISSGIATLSSNRNSVRLLYKDIKSLNTSSYELELAPPNKEDKLGSFEEIELQKISFSYTTEAPKALEEVEIKVKKGEAIGIIGPSGSGKSTLLDILLGVLYPQKGKILVNGSELKKEDIFHWLKKVAYLPQDIFITDDNVLNNVALGDTPSSINPQEVEEALKKANLYDFIQTLPEALKTNLGERGSRLSGGQKQRIALARGFYHNRDVLIMDESTSALDTETEEEIVREIESLKKVKTVIIVAHRLSTLRHCDRIYKLDSGKIIQVGSYDEVIHLK